LTSKEIAIKLVSGFWIMNIKKGNYLEQVEALAAETVRT
jgi:hypothetical protein